MKTKLVSALGLGLPDLKKPFKLYVHERQGTSLRVFTQTLGNIPPSIAMIASLLPQIDLSKYQPMYSEKDKERAKEQGSLLIIPHLAGNVMHKELYWLLRPSWIPCCSACVIVSIMGEMPPYNGFKNQKYIMRCNLQRTIQQSLKIAWFVLKITQRLLSDLLRQEPHTEEPAPLRSGKLDSNASNCRKF